MRKIWSVVTEIFHIYCLRSSSIGGCLHSKYLYSLVWPQNLTFKFVEDPTSGCCYISLLIFKVVFYCRWFSIGGHLHSEHFHNLVWSHNIKFKIWARSDRWSLRYFTFNIWCRLSFEVVLNLNIFIIWFGHIS